MRGEPIRSERPRRESALRSFFIRVWDSPTLTTWGSFAARTLSLVLVLPLVLRRLTPAEFTVWSIFSSITGLQMVAELGFGVTFARVIAYAMGGAQDLPAFNPGLRPSSGKLPNWDLIRRIFETMPVVYGRLAAIFGVLLLLPATAALWTPVSRCDPSSLAWLAWGVVLLGTVFSFKNLLYVSLLQGTNHIAVLRRWETFFGLGSIATGTLVLLSGGTLLPLMVASQSWVLLGVCRNRWLCRTLFGHKLHTNAPPRIDPSVMAVVWPSAWRSGLGTGMSLGIVHITGLVVAQHPSVSLANSYLLGLRLIQAINQISAAPFYSKLPLLSRYFAAGKHTELIAYAARGMRFAYWAFVIPFALAGLLGPLVVERLKSGTPFPSAGLWILFGAAYFCERYGAMHLQLYTLTNHIVWHVANGVAGVLTLLTLALLWGYLGPASVPLALLIGNLGFFCWYSARLSHRQFGLPWPRFDLTVVGAPALCFLLAILCMRFGIVQALLGRS